MAAVERKINMTLDDIIKSTSTRSSGGGPERRQQKAADERIPLPRNGIAPKFIGASARQGARATDRHAQNSRALGLTARQVPMKKYAQSRAPLHVSIPSGTARSPGRAAGGKVTDVRVTIPNNRKVRSLPPPGFAESDDLHVPPPGMQARAGRGGTGRAPTLNERFTRFLSSPSGAQPHRRSAGSGRGNSRRGLSGNSGNGAMPMEM